MRDASAVVLGVVLVQRRDKILQPIYYASNVLDEAQKNYNVSKQEILALELHLRNFAPICLARES